MEKDFERLERLLRSSKATIWRIENNSGVKKGSYEGETTEDAIQALRDRYNDLSAGNYVLKYRKSSTNEKGQDSENFVVPRGGKESSNYQSSNNMGDSLQTLLQIVKEQAEMKVEMQYMRKELDQLRQEVKGIYDDLMDEDPENDKSALDRLSEIADKVPKIANTVKSFKDL